MKIILKKESLIEPNIGNIFKLAYLLRLLLFPAFNVKTKTSSKNGSELTIV